MMRWEALAVTGPRLTVGLAVAAATLMPFSLAMGGGTVPYIPWPFLVGVGAGGAVLAIVATALPTRAALRRDPTEAVMAPE